MIKKDCLSREWIDSVSKRLHYNDKGIIEKVIRALNLLEMLVKSGCPFVFKGGTATMLLLGDSSNRVSIDIDVICPPGTEIEQYLKNYAEYGFTEYELVERKQAGKNVPKSHSKFFYQMVYKAGLGNQTNILLDVLYEDLHYTAVHNAEIRSPFLEIEGEPTLVKVPSVADILGDKLTAFAPNTTGIPYFKGPNLHTLEIIKQLYDIGRLFEKIEDTQVTAQVFGRIAQIEMGYREMVGDFKPIYNDIRETALNISTRGMEGAGHFDLLQDGITRIKSFIWGKNYYIESAIIDAARAAYLATCIERGVEKLDKYDVNNPQLATAVIKPTLTNRLNKLRTSIPEAYWYWCKTSELL